MLRNLGRVAVTVAPKSRLFSSSTYIPTVRTQSELFREIFATRLDEIKKEAIDHFPLNQILQDAASRHCRIERDSAILDSIVFTKCAVDKDNQAFIDKYKTETLNYVEKVIYDFLFKLHDALSKFPGLTFYQTYNAVVEEFVNEYKHTSSLNAGEHGHQLTMSLEVENILRVNLLNTLEGMRDKYQHTAMREKQKNEIHNHCHLSVKCGGKK